MLLPDRAIRDLSSMEVGQRLGRFIHQLTEPFGPDTLKVLRTIEGGKKPMIKPFVDNLRRSVDVNVSHGKKPVKVPSYGLSSYGYDVRLSKEIKIFTNTHGGLVDPIAHSDENMVDAKIKVDDDGLEYFILPPNSYALGVTLEYFCIPKTITALCLGKSTYARCAVEINTTVIEAGFEGQVVIEIANGSTLPVKIYLGGGIAQFLFMEGVSQCEIDYSVGNRKYQGQTGITYSKG